MPKKKTAKKKKAAKKSAVSRAAGAVKNILKKNQEYKIVRKLTPNGIKEVKVPVEPEVKGRKPEADINPDHVIRQKKR